MYKWDIGQVLDTIASERITQLSASPAMMLQLFTDPRFDATDTRSLSWIGFGGAGIPGKLIEQVSTKKPLAMAGIGASSMKKILICRLGNPVKSACVASPT